MFRFLIVALAFLFFACGGDRKADKVIFGKIWTADYLRTWAEGMAIVDDTIAAIGNEQEIRAWMDDDTEVIESAPGSLILPGFIDCHTHFVDGGFALLSVQLRDAKTREEFINRIAAYARKLPAGTWITSGDWDHENWGGELPTRDWIDSVTKDHPVWINRLDGHMCLANSKALSLAGINDQVIDVKGGTIVRDRSKRITGIFKDNAMPLVGDAVPEPSDEQQDRALDTAMRYVASKGVTSVHNMSGYHRLFERARKRKRLKTRIYAGMLLSEWRTLHEKVKEDGNGDKWLRFGGLKEFVDGSLGSHTAAFFKPYTDSPKDSGFFVIDEKTLFNRIKSADSAKLQVMVHAIGDRAVRLLLNTLFDVEKVNGPRDRRFRIEHAQHIDPDDFKRFSIQKVIASMQPYHAIDDGRWAEKVIGPERIKTTYAFKSLMEANATLVFGSDWYVAPPTPLDGIYAAVTRQTLDGRNPEGWVPEQKITVDEALRAYTIYAAYASFEENIKGSLSRGKLADFVVLEKDITIIPPQEIRNVKVLKTVVGGEVVYDAPGNE